MTVRRGFTHALVLFSAAAVVVAEQQPTFRSSADLVPVYVSVRSGRAPQGGLTAADFALTDRGVEQTIEAVSFESVPIDVTLLVDTSASVITSLARFKSDARTIVTGLHADEQIRLITFDTHVRQILPMQPPSATPPVAQIRLGDQTSLLDAIAFAIARPRRPDRRHLIFVFTDGYDTSSVLDYGAMPELAGRIEGLLHIVLVKSSDPPTDAVRAHMAALAAAAARTGGALYTPEATGDDLVAAFNDAIESFRHSYVVFFSPTGVEREGWHDIAVRVTKPGNFSVRAREGYYGQ